MNKKLLILAFVFFMPGFVFAQYQIKLDKSNTYKGGASFLIDIPYNDIEIDSLYIDNRSGIIPISVLIATRNRIWNNLHTLMILDKKEKSADGSSLKPIIIINKPSKAGKYALYKKLLSTNKNKSDSILIYYSEQHGTGCCSTVSEPKVNSITNFIKQFEDINKVKIGKSYYITVGDEGEYIAYYTLDGLSQTQKINFIDQRVYSYDPFSNRETKSIGKISQIFVPIWVSKKHLRIK